MGDYWNIDWGKEIFTKVAVLLDAPMIPAGMTGIQRNPAMGQESAGIHRNRTGMIDILELYSHILRYIYTRYIYKRYISSFYSS